MAWAMAGIRFMVADILLNTGLERVRLEATFSNDQLITAI
jgi:hypothetical protein